MIKRKELQEYARIRQIQALRITIDNKNFLHIQSVMSLCNCAYAVRAIKYARKAEYELAAKTFGDKKIYSFEVFIKDTVEYNMAMAYISALGWTHSQGMDIEYTQCQYKGSMGDTMNKSLSDIITLNTINSNYLFQIEALARKWEIDLHYYVDESLNYHEQCNTIGLI